MTFDGSVSQLAYVSQSGNSAVLFKLVVFFLYHVQTNLKGISLINRWHSFHIWWQKRLLLSGIDFSSPSNLQDIDKLTL